jgi:hypothetical protein
MVKYNFKEISIDKKYLDKIPTIIKELGEVFDFNSWHFLYHNGRIDLRLSRRVWGITKKPILIMISDILEVEPDELKLNKFKLANIDYYGGKDAEKFIYFGLNKLSEMMIELVTNKKYSFNCKYKLFRYMNHYMINQYGLNNYLESFFHIFESHIWIRQYIRSYEKEYGKIKAFFLRIKLFFLRMYEMS